MSDTVRPVRPIPPLPSATIGFLHSQTGRLNSVPFFDRLKVVLALLDDEDAEVTEHDVRPLLKRAGMEFCNRVELQDELASLRAALLEAVGTFRTEDLGENPSLLWLVSLMSQRLAVERQEVRDLESCLGRIRATCEAAGIPGETREPDPDHPDDRTEDITTKWSTDKLVERLAAKLAAVESNTLARLLNDYGSPLSTREARLLRLVVDVGHAIGVPRPTPTTVTTLAELDAHLAEVLTAALAFAESRRSDTDDRAAALERSLAIARRAGVIGETERESQEVLVERLATRVHRASEYLDQVVGERRPMLRDPWVALRKVAAILDGTEA